MKMKDWIEKLDDFLKLSEKKILTHAGTISAREAETRAQAEFENYRKTLDKKYISDFDKEMKKYLKPAKK